MTSAYAGTNFLGDFDYKKDAFYNFNTIARRKVYKGSFVHDQNVIVDGGGSYGSYLFGLSNHYDSGVLDDTKFERQSLFFNAKYNITDKFTAQFFNDLALTDRYGRYAGEYDRELSRPVIEDEEYFMDKKRNIALLSSMNLKYDLTSDFYIKSLFGLSYEGSRRDFYIPSTILGGSKYSLSTAYKRQLITLNTTLNYRHQFESGLKLIMTIGNEIINRDNRLTYVDGERSMEDGGSNYVKVVTGYSASQTNAMSDHLQENLVSYYGTWKLNYTNLQLNFVLRTDGSSLYEHKWALYPAFGAIYNLKDVLGVPLTANASIGKTGVLSRPDTYRGELTSFGDYYEGTKLGIGELYEPFKDAKSIGVFQVDAGVTYEITKSLSFSANYFSKNYKDFTYQRYLSNISGLDYQYETGAELSLYGIELSLTGRIINHNRFSWSCNFNLASDRNKVKSLPDDIENTSLSQFSQLKEGDAITSFVAYEDNVSKIIGDSKSNYFGGFSNMFRYGNISASFTITYSQGANVIAESFDSRYSEDLINGDFPLKDSETPYYYIEEDEDGNTIYQGIKSVEDGSFIRLSKAMLAYNFNSLVKNSAIISDMELYVRADNLVTLSKYGGVNPEENITGIREYDLSYTGTPLPASVVLGLKLKF